MVRIPDPRYVRRGSHVGVGTQDEPRVRPATAPIAPRTVEELRAAAHDEVTAYKARCRCGHLGSYHGERQASPCWLPKCDCQRFARGDK